MDTTAAAELGGGVVDGGVGFWDSGPPELEGWAGAEKSSFDSGPPNVHGLGEGGGTRARPSSGTYNMEPPSKRMRNMGGGDGYGSSGNFNSPGGFAQGGHPDGSGQRAGYGPPPGTPSGGESSGAGQGMSRGRGMGSIFYKTKLCSRFRNGNCPYSTNCNFAHGMDELRRPPPGWEDNSGPQEGGGTGASGGGAGGGSGSGSAGAAPAAAGGGGNAPGGGGSGGVSTSDAGGGAGSAGVIPNQPPGQSPSIQGVSNDMQRFHKTRPCKKYFSELGCPYGDRCNFLHHEPNPQTPSKPARESVVVTVATNAPGNGTASSAAPAPSPTQRPPNWKTRLCNKWETTGNCPFGDKCHFAHGSAELQRYRGGPIDPSSAEGSAGNFADVDEGFSNYSEGFAQAGNLRQSSSLRNSRHGQGSGMVSKSSAIWKGPTDGISTIYGDWVEEDEWETSGAQIAKDLQQFGQSTSSIVHRGTDLGNETYSRKDKEPRNTPLLRNSNGQNQGNAFLSASGSARGHGQSSQEFDLGYAEAGLGL